VRETLRRAAALLVLAAAGCGGGDAAVSGTVTYEGVPVKSGYITFAPEDGKGTPAAAPIADGKYTVPRVSPGKKVVRVEAGGDSPSIRSSEEAAKMTPEQRERYDPKTGVIRTGLPDDAVGNNQTVELKPGDQTLDFPLKKPAKK
jgi:hypothetical protein